MSRILFEEEQRFTSLGWIWIAASLPMVLLIILLAFDQTITFEKFSKIFGFSLIAYLPLIFFLLISKLQIRVDQLGIHFRFFPVQFTWKLVSKDMIASYEISAKRTLYERIACGYRRNRLLKSIIMNITGIHFLRLQLQEGRKVKIGIDNPEGLTRAMKKLMSSDSP